MIRQFAKRGLFVLCFILLSSPAQADEELSKLLRAESSKGNGQEKKLHADEAQEKQKKLQQMLVEEKKQKHQQRLNKELEKLDKLIETYQLPMKVERSKWWLRKDKTIKKLRSTITIKAKRLRGLTFQLQTLYTSIEGALQEEEQALKKYLRAQKIIGKLITKQFPLERIGGLRKIMSVLEERINKKKSEQKVLREKAPKLEKQSALNKKLLKKLRKTMFQETEEPKEEEKEPKEEEKTKKKRTQQQPKPSKATLLLQEKKIELEQNIGQLKSLQLRLQFSYLTQQGLLYKQYKRELSLRQGKISVDIQLFRLTLEQMAGLYKFHSAKLEGGALHHEPFSINLKLFGQVSKHSQMLIKNSPQKSSQLFSEFIKAFKDQYTKQGIVWFIIFFLFLPILLVVSVSPLKRRLKEWNENSDPNVHKNQTIQQLHKFLLLLSGFAQDLLFYAVGFVLFYFLLKIFPLTAGWNNLLLQIAGVFIATRAMYSLTNKLFAAEQEQRYLTELSDESAKRFRVALKLVIVFSLPYWLALQTLALIGFPEVFTSLLQLLFFGTLLFWLLSSFFKSSIWKQLQSPPSEIPQLNKILLYRIYPVLLLNFTASFIVYLFGYRNLASYIAMGLSMTVVILCLAYGMYYLFSLIILWMLSIEKEHVGAVTPKIRIAKLLRVGSGVLLGFVALGFILEVWDVPKGWHGILWVLDYPFLRFQKSQLSLLSFLKFFIVFGGTLWFSRRLREKLSSYVYPSLGVELGTQHAINTVLGYVFLVAGLLAALQIMGMGLGILSIFAGALGIGIGFGLRDIASNFISGLILIFGRPISVGDVIVVDGSTGIVRSISARSTTIETAAKHIILLPNAKLITSQVENLSKGPPFIRVGTSIGVAYDSDLELVRETLMEIAKGNPKAIDEPPPAVFIKEFGDNNITFGVSVSTRNLLLQGGVKNWMHDTIATRFRELGIEMAFPQTDLHLDPEVHDTFRTIKEHLIQQNPKT